VSKYLDRFKSTMPAVQGRQILKLLNGMKDRGTITSVAEYNAKLQELTEHLKGTNPQPIFNYFAAEVGEAISSDTFNAMVEAATFDLEAAFQEADNVSDVLDLHKTLYKLTVLKALEKAVKDLEKTISLYEFFNRDYNGFTQAQFNTFNEIEGMSSKRTDADAGSLFYDFNKREDVRETEDCQIDLLGEQLVLPANSFEELKVIDVTLVDDADTTVPVRDTQYATSGLQNIRDQRKHTYWLYPVLVSDPIVGGVKIKIKLDLGGIRELNSVSIEPACPFPMILEKIEYIGEDSLTRTITFDSTIDSDVSYSLGGIETQFLSLTFVQETVESAVYHRDPADNMWDRVWGNDADAEEPDPLSFDRILKFLTAEIPDAYIREVLDIPTTSQDERVDAHQYTFGFDNIRINLTKYRSRGLFVGKKFTANSVGLLGLRASEDNPTVQMGNISYPQFAFEYYVVKYDYDSGGGFVSKETIPILPVEDGGAIQHERLFPVFTATGSSVPNVTMLRFTPDVGSGDPVLTKNLTDTLVIGDGTLETHDYEVLVEGDDWSTDWTDSWSTIETRIENGSDTVVPMTVYIKFHNPSIHSIYTVSYQASTRNTDSSDALPRKLLDFVTIQDNFILRCGINKESTVKSSELYLVVIMRNNYIYQTATPALTEYKLLVSSYDNNKFLE
jgi:hypothetical protein